MNYFINCGEQDIEDDGICISLSVCQKSSSDIFFLNLIDNLFGILDFALSCEYNYAEVGIDLNEEFRESPIKDYEEFDKFLSMKDNEEIRNLVYKYLDLFEFSTSEEAGTLWFYISLQSTDNYEMSAEDLDKFQKIYRERMKCIS